MNMKHRLLLLILLTFSIVAASQVRQPGIVREYNEKSAKTPLGGVELNVRSAGSTVSGRDGEFELEFQTLKAGDYVTVRRIEKPGYEIFNREAVEQWNINPDRPFTVVMCRTDRFRQLRDRYEKAASASYARQLKKDQAALDRLKAEGKVREEEYLTERQRLIEDYERQLDDLDSYVDRFTRIDLSELTGAEQEIIDLVGEGRMDEAIVRYEQLHIVDNLLDQLRKRDQVRSAIIRLEEEKASVRKSNDSLYAMADRHIQTLQLAGGKENNRKILSIYRKIADADTTNVKWLLKTGNFINHYIADYPLALEYYNKALRSAIAAGGPENPDAATAYNNIGYIHDTWKEYSKAIECYSKALEIFEKAYGPEYPGVGTALNNIGLAYKSQDDCSKALDYFEKALDVHVRIDGGENQSYAATCSNIGGVYLSMRDYAKALDFYQKAFVILENTAGMADPAAMTVRVNIGKAYTNLGEYSRAIDHYQKALAVAEKVYGREHPAVADIYGNLGEVTMILKDYPTAIGNYSNALEIYENIFGPEHADVARMCEMLGYAYCIQGKYVESLGYLERSSAIHEQLDGGEGERARSVQSMLISIYGMLGALSLEEMDLDSALGYFLKELTLEEKCHKGGDSKIAETSFYVGAVLNVREDYSRAIDYYKRTAGIYANEYGPGDLNVSIVQGAIYKCLAAMEDARGLESFMDGKAWILVVDEDSPATVQVLPGEYYLLELNGCDSFSGENLYEKASPQMRMTLMRDGMISDHIFMDDTGLDLALKNVVPADLSGIKGKYQEWKSSH